MNLSQLFRLAIMTGFFAGFLLMSLTKIETTETCTVEDRRVETLEIDQASYREALTEKQRIIDGLRKKLENKRVKAMKAPDPSNRKRIFAESNRRYALASELNWGIPYDISLGQAILESNAGESYLATEANNYFGIKCGQKKCRHEKTCVLIETKEEVNGEMITKKARFRRYESAAEGFDEHGRFLNGNRYSKIHKYDKTEYVNWAIAIKTAGYATDSKYPNKLIKVIEKYVR